MIKHKLCGIETVCSLSGQSKEQIYDLVDAGDYLWVWNVSCMPDATRELRFWSAEINFRFLNTQAFKRFTAVDQIIPQLLPNRQSLPGQYNGLRHWELCNLLRVGRTHLAGLASQLPPRRRILAAVPAKAVYFAMPDIANFFRARWCGAICTGSTTKTKTTLATK